MTIQTLFECKHKDKQKKAISFIHSNTYYKAYLCCACMSVSNLNRLPHKLRKQIEIFTELSQKADYIRDQQNCIQQSASYIDKLDKEIKTALKTYEKT